MVEETSFELLDDETPPIPAAAVSLGRGFTMRPYQRECITSVIDGFKETDVKRQLVSAATGTGKTVIFSALAALTQKDGNKALILAHRDELIDQAIDKFQVTTGLRAAKEKASWYASRYDKVVVGSVQTMCGDVRLSTWRQNHFNLVIVDECHRTLSPSYLKILNHFGAGGANVVGFTATADRGDRRSLGEFYQRIAFDYGLLRACRDGWLVRPMVQTIPLNIDLRGVATKKTEEGTDFDRIEVGQRLVPFLDQIAAEIRARAGAKRILIFLPSIECAQLMAKALVKIGVTSDWVCGDKNICPDRRRIIQRHGAGGFQALCNMALLTEGYDDDEIEVLVVLRPTKIRSLYAQMIGRGTRPVETVVRPLNAAPNAAARLGLIASSSKPFLQIYDFLWLYEKHDLIKPASLVAPTPKVAAQMGDVDGDLIAAEERAEVDLFKKLADEIRKNSNRAAKVIDPLEMAISLHDVEAVDYEPETDRDAMAPTPRQINQLKQNGIDIKKIKWRGQASQWVARILKRHELGLATFRQLNFMRSLKLDITPDLTRAAATERIDAKIGKKSPPPDNQGELPV